MFVWCDVAVLAPITRTHKPTHTHTHTHTHTRTMCICDPHCLQDYCSLYFMVSMDALSVIRALLIQRLEDGTVGGDADAPRLVLYRQVTILEIAFLTLSDVEPPFANPIVEALCFPPRKLRFLIVAVLFFPI